MSNTPAPIGSDLTTVKQVTSVIRKGESALDRAEGSRLTAWAHFVTSWAAAVLLDNTELQQRIVDVRTRTNSAKTQRRARIKACHDVALATGILPGESDVLDVMFSWIIGGTPSTWWQGKDRAVEFLKGIKADAMTAQEFALAMEQHEAEAKGAGKPARDESDGESDGDDDTPESDPEVRATVSEMSVGELWATAREVLAVLGDLADTNSKHSAEALEALRDIADRATVA